MTVIDNDDPMSAFDVRDRVALITGGSRGLGAAMALGFSKCGARVVVVSRSGGDSVVNRIRHQGGEALGIAVDLARPDELEPIISETIRCFSRLDILINNAAEYFQVAPAEVSSADFDRIFSVNVKSPLLLAKHGLPYLEASGHGSIINVLSTAIWDSEPLGILYRSSKSALLGITMVLAKTWASRGIRVNAIAPGSFETDMMSWLDEAMLRRLTQAIPMKRLGHPDEVIAAALYLASDASSFTTGQMIRIDGGLISA